jgi:MFS family permease
MAASSSRAARQASRRDLTAVGLVAVVFLTEAVIGILLLAVNPQYPKAELGADAKLVGGALSVYFAAKAIGQPLSGWLADRIRPRLVMTGGVLICIPAVAWMLTVRSAFSYLAAWLLFGLTLAVVWPAMYAIVGRHFRATLHGRLLAIISAGQIAGTASGTGLGAVLIDRVSYTAAFLIAGGMLVLATLIAGSLIHDSGPHERSEQEHTAARPSSWLAVLTRDTLALIAVITALSFATSMLAPDLKPYSDQVLHLKYSQFVLLLAPPAAIAGALLVPSGWLGDRIGRALPLLSGLLLFGVGIGFVAESRSSAEALVALCLAAVGYVLTAPSLSALLLDLASPRNRGLLTGLATSIQAVGGVLGPTVGGALISGYGPRSPLRAAALVVFVTLLLAMPFSLRVHRARRRAENPV